MTGINRNRGRAVAGLALTFAVSWWLASNAEAGGHFHKRNREVVTTTRTVCTQSSGTLGTFYPTPYITVRGSYPTGGGYSPLGLYGDTSMALYGPTSTRSAPFGSFAGYDGRTYAPGRTSFSTPNPSRSSGRHPTQATNYYGPRNRPPPGEEWRRLDRSEPPLSPSREGLQSPELSPAEPEELSAKVSAPSSG